MASNSSAPTKRSAPSDDREHYKRRKRDHDRRRSRSPDAGRSSPHHETMKYAKASRDSKDSRASPSPRQNGDSRRSPSRKPHSPGRTHSQQTQSNVQRPSRQDLNDQSNSSKRKKPGHENRDVGPNPRWKSILDMNEQEAAESMKKTMGFTDFKSTKNSKVPGNDKLYAVRKEKKTEYRQYMNRTGGFNRPLSPSR